jgi:sigma-B regulation protein RsbU (phosphoserine phosphatase)
MIFEPAAGLRSFFDEQLKRAEVAVSYATSLQAARKTLADNPDISLVFVDLTVAREGLLLIREIDEDFPFIQSIVIIPEGAIKLLRQGMNRGAADFIIWPPTEKMFQEVLANVMVKVQARREMLRTRKRYAMVRKDLEIAGKIQHSMLPIPKFEQERISLFASLIPAADIGGDFFDYFFIDRNRMCFLIGDVSGKGVSAALFMAVSRSILRSNGLQKLSPARCLEKTNQMLCSNNDAGMFVTVFYGIVDLEEGKLSYANGGHNPPYLIRHDRTVESVDRTGDMALGIFEENTYNERTIPMRSGECLYLYTDGIVEAVDHNYRLYGNDRLEEALHLSEFFSCQQLIEDNLTALKKFTGGMGQSDDITSMAVKLI